MAEQLDLAVPEVKPEVVTTAYRVARMWLDVEGETFSVQLRGTNGERREIRREGPEALALMVALNTANLSIRSLQRRVLEWAVSQGELAGVVSGTPDT